MAMIVGVRSRATLSLPSPFSCGKVAFLVQHRRLVSMNVLPQGRVGKTPGRELQSVEGAGNDPLGSVCGWYNGEFPFLGEARVPMESPGHRAAGSGCQTCHSALDVADAQPFPGICPLRFVHGQFSRPWMNLLPG